MLHPVGIWLFLPAALLSGASFSGSLERVGNQSISVRLADRRVIDAMLPNTPPLEAAAMAAEYRSGDEVEINCKKISPVWEEGTGRYQSLEVTAIRLVRRPAAAEVSRMAPAIPFREGKNLLQGTNAAAPQLPERDG